MDLRHLRYFVTLAEQRHFGRAAEALNMAQPPLSQQIKALEDELGVTLFDRSTRPIALTRAGTVLFREARQILHHVSRARTATQRAGRGESGQVVVGTTGSAALDVQPPVLAAFRARCPQAQVALREMSSPDQTAALGRGDIHVGFVRPPILDDRLSARLVHREPFIVALPDSHSLAAAEAVSLADLNGTALVIFDPAEAPGFHDLIIHLCRTAGYDPAVTLSAAQMTTMLTLVAAAYGFALVPRSARRLALPGIAFRPLLDEPCLVDLYAVWIAARETPLVAELLAVLDAARPDSLHAEGPASRGGR